MTIKDLIKDKDYDYIEYRLSYKNKLGDDKGDVFAGECKSENGKLISLDGDIYNENEKVLRYEEFTNKDTNVKHGLSIVCKGQWV